MKVIFIPERSSLSIVVSGLQSNGYRGTPDTSNAIAAKWLPSGEHTKIIKKLLNMAIIVDLPSKKCDFPWLCLLARGFMTKMETINNS